MNPVLTLFSLFQASAVVSYMVGLAIPAVTGYLTKSTADPFVKVSVTSLLSAVSAVVAQWVQSDTDHTHFAWQSVILTALVTWGTAEFAYAKVWAKDTFQKWFSTHGPKWAKLSVLGYDKVVTTTEPLTVPTVSATSVSVNPYAGEQPDDNLDALSQESAKPVTAVKPQVNELPL